MYHIPYILAYKPISHISPPDPLILLFETMCLSISHIHVNVLLGACACRQNILFRIQIVKHVSIIFSHVGYDEYAYNQMPAHIQL